LDETGEHAPLCFVLMPFGKKMDAVGRVTNFDSVYAKIIAPAVEHGSAAPSTSMMEMSPKPDPRQSEILPVVRYSAARKAAKAPDYWDHATLLELAVLARDPDDDADRLGDALAVGRASCELETTARNLSLIGDMRAGRGEDAAWIKGFEDTLTEHARRLEGDKPLS